MPNDTSTIQTPQVQALIKAKELHELRDYITKLSAPDIAELLSKIEVEEQAVVFRILPRDLATEVFEFLETDSQIELVSSLGNKRVAVLLNEMSPDDRTALFEELPAPITRRLVNLLSKEERTQALTLLGYPESSIGRLMSPDYISVKEDWDMVKVLEHIRQHGKSSDSLDIIYVVNERKKFVGELNSKDILLAGMDNRVAEIMSDKIVSLSALDDQEMAVQAFSKYSKSALPVVDSDNSILGIVTIDDVLDVAEEEATEDIQKFGGSEALDEPYLKAPFLKLIRTRSIWLIVLFIGEMFTASAMSFFSDEIAKAVVLALFIPLIISSGGNSGSQAATLVIRALSIGEIELKDWYKVLKREVASGIVLGSVLGIIGFARVVFWAKIFPDAYGVHAMGIAIIVLCSLVGVVIWGTITGSMLPFILKKLGADPAASSAPFVATLVDVVGLIIYFSVASVFLTNLIN